MSLSPDFLYSLYYLTAWSLTSFSKLQPISVAVPYWYMGVCLPTQAHTVHTHTLCPPAMSDRGQLSLLHRPECTSHHSRRLSMTAHSVIPITNFLGMRGNKRWHGYYVPWLPYFATPSPVPCVPCVRSGPCHFVLTLRFF